MWIVRLALRRPYTFVVFAIVIVLLTPLVLLRTPTDIFPNIAIPVVSTVWNYGGLSAPEMANRIVSIYERAATITVNDIEHIESQSLAGIAVVKIFFQPKVKIDAAVSQVTAIAQTVLRQMPPGTTPPLVITYSASTVPVLQLALAGRGPLRAAALRRRQYRHSHPARHGRGRRDPVPVRRQAAAGPGGSEPRGAAVAESRAERRRQRAQRAEPHPADRDLQDRHVRVLDRDEQQPHDDPGAQRPARARGRRRGGLRPRRGAGSRRLPAADEHRPRERPARGADVDPEDRSRVDADIIARVREVLAQTAGSLPPNLRVTPIADQSLFVRASIEGVIKEALIAACLTGLMILLFLGSWRSTLIIAVSIPLSILMSILVLSALGETINIMTLGGFALAVGILVDDATVEIENINRNRAQGKEILQAILDGAAQIAVPAFVSTLSICIVFVPMFFLTGVARYLFVPLAEAVCFALLASYFLSRTLVPTMARFLLSGPAEENAEPRNVFARLQRRFEERFERLREGYRHVLERVMARPRLFAALFLAFCAGSAALLLPWLGRDFFPSVDSGQIKLHVRARTGTRIEETARLCDRIDASIRASIPPSELDTIIDNIGLPYSGINLSYSNSAPVGSGDADIFVTMKKRHRPVELVARQLRERLSGEFPGVTFYFLPVDMVSQILNFGLSAPIDVQIIGNDLAGNRALAERLLDRMRRVPGAVDLRIQQAFDAPRLFVAVDRSRAEQIGYNQRDIAGNLLIALSGSAQVSPTYWLDPKNGVTYPVAVQAPQYQIESFAQLRDIPVTGPVGRPPQILGNLASITRGAQLATVSHYNTQPVIDIFGAVDGTDLGSVAGPIDASARRRPQGASARLAHHSARPDPHDARLLQGIAARARDLDRPRLHADRRQLPVLARSADHRLRPAGGDRRDRLAPLPRAHPAVGARAHGRDHVHGRRDGEQHPRRELRKGAASPRTTARRRRRSSPASRASGP